MTWVCTGHSVIHTGDTVLCSVWHGHTPYNKHIDLTPVVAMETAQLSPAKVLAKGFLVSSSMFTAP